MDDGLGGKIWLGMIGAIVACGAGAFLLFILIEASWYRWGAIGSLLFFSGLILAWAWAYDRRHRKQWAEQFDE